MLAPQNSPKQHGLPTGPCSVQYEVSSQESVYTFWEKRWKLAAPPFIFPFIFHSSSTMSLPTISNHNDIVLSPFATLVITTHGNKTPLQSSGCFFFLQRLSLLNTGTDTDGGESFFFRHFNAYNASSTETQSTILGDNCNKVLLSVKRQIYRTSLMQNFVLRPKHIHSSWLKHWLILRLPSVPCRLFGNNLKPN